MNSKNTQFSDKQPGTRYFVFTRYDETGGELESNGTTGSMKNFPRVFIPMEELQESSLEE